jgi:prephenate dehydratase
MRLGYLGPPGTHGEQAALLYDGAADLVAHDSHVAVVDAVAAGKVDKGIVAFESSTAGCVIETLDGLLSRQAVHICDELVLRTDQYLVAAPGTSLENVRLLISHPQAVAQCRVYLSRVMPSIEHRASTSTALAVQEAVKTLGAAAIGSKRAADLAGGSILAERIQDSGNNRMRFLILAREDASPTGRDKTAVTFVAAPGTLSSHLSVLIGHVELTHVETRPGGDEPGSYAMFVEFLGHWSEPACSESLSRLNQATQARILGSFPCFEGEANDDESDG